MWAEACNVPPLRNEPFRWVSPPLARRGDVLSDSSCPRVEAASQSSDLLLMFLIPEIRRAVWSGVERPAILLGPASFGPGSASPAGLTGRT